MWPKITCYEIQAVTMCSCSDFEVVCTYQGHHVCTLIGLDREGMFQVVVLSRSLMFLLLLHEVWDCSSHNLNPNINQMAGMAQ